VAGCVLQLTVGSRALSEKTPTMGLPTLWKTADHIYNIQPTDAQCI